MDLPLGIGWMNIILIMPLIVLGAWVCGFQSEDYAELFKLAAVAVFAPILIVPLLALFFGALFPPLTPVTDSGSRFGIVLLFSFLYLASYGAVMTLAAKRLVTCSWREALIFAAIVAGGSFLLNLLIK